MNLKDAIKEQRNERTVSYLGGDVDEVASLERARGKRANGHKQKGDVTRKKLAWTVKIAGEKPSWLLEK